MNFTKVGIIGSGSWATALLKIVSEQEQTQIQWWVRREEDVNHIQQFKHNPKYLSAVEINLNKVTVSTNLQSIIDSCEVIVFAVPSAFFSSCLQDIHLPKNKFYVSAIKGIDPNTKKIIAHYLIDEFQIPQENIGLITGPCHAEEVALEKLSYLTLSALNEEKAATLEMLVSCRFINTKINTDLFGAEYAAVLKNIYAIGSGVAHGLGYGDNFQSVYVAAALREMDFFLENLHETHRDVKNAAYLGDLLVTCYSQFSRNRTFGNMLGKGYSTASAQLEMNMVAEGYYAVGSIVSIIAELQIHLPIIEAVHAVTHLHQPAKQVFFKLSSILE